MTVRTMLKKNSLGAGGLALVGVLFIGIMLLANHLLRGAKIDLTADNLYTVSQGTKNIVRGLKEPVNLYFFFSEEAVDKNPALRNHGVRVRELLEELVSLSGGTLTLKVVDPQPFSEEEDRANELGITSSTINASGDKLYMGLAATNSTDGKGAIPYLDPRREEQLEYDVAKLVHELSAAKKPVVGWLSSLPMGGDFDMQTGRQRPPLAVYQQIEQLYELRALEPTLTAVDADVNVLVLVHPKNLPPPALYAIDQYALRGGHILVFVDPRSEADPAAAADPGNPMAQMQAARSSDLAPLFKAWGVDYDPGQVVGDLERGLAVAMREGEAPAQHIAILGLDATAMGKDVVTAQIDSVNLATAGSLKPLAAPQAGTTLTFEPLMRSGKQAGLLPVQRFAMLTDPGTLKDGFKPTGEFVVAARVTGKTKSAFADGPPPGVAAAAGALKESAEPLNVVIVADTDLLTDFMWVQQANFFGQIVFQPFANNGELVWNAIDNLGGSNDLISIRARAAYSRPFERVEALRRNADAELRAKEQQLQQELQQTEETLTKLQTSQPGGNDAILSPEMAREIERFQDQKLRIRKELRATRAGLAEDIEALGRRLKAVNTLLMPGILIGLGLMVALWRKRRRHAIAMLRKGSAA
jgi:ABC-type uncharacterized transport system involved in gliding motility auxiliary subunit